MSSVPFKTDAVVKGSLNVGLISGAGTRGSGGVGGIASEPTSEAYLDTFQEELHKKVDGDIEILVDGLQDCVALAKVGTKDRFKAEQDSAEIELKAESMVRATESLLSLSHTLKLLFLLDNEDEGSSKTSQSQHESAAKELTDAKDDARDVLAELLARQ